MNDEFKRIVRALLISAPAIIVLILLVVWLLPKYMHKEQTLRGVLVDLEFSGPDSSRYADLTDAFVRILPTEVAPQKDLRISLEYIHFSELKKSFFDGRYIDFVILSPQNTPWNRYYREIPDRMAAVQELLRELILSRNMPVLGICGGHQFLAAAFGGTVDFIDPKFRGLIVDTYPAEALAERGPVDVETLADDPVFEGVAKHPGQFIVIEIHREEVKTVPQAFVNLARSGMSEIQLIHMPGKIVYGTAFHPERGWNPAFTSSVESTAGKGILTNFLRMVLHQT